jgi:hypothetical protein
MDKKADNLTFIKDDIIFRGNSRDYDIWAEAGNSGWSFAEVKQYFQKSAARTDLHGLGKVNDYVLDRQGISSQIHSPCLGDNVNSGLGLSYLPARLRVRPFRLKFFFAY